MQQDPVRRAEAEGITSETFVRAWAESDAILLGTGYGAEQVDAFATGMEDMLKTG